MTIFALMLGCSFEENLPEKDILGKVIVPRAAATRQTLSDPDGDATYEGPTETVDIRNIGPIYLGAFGGMDTRNFDYPHPAMGPIVEANIPGDTFPYGGTSVGRVDFACYETLACRVTTGRYRDYDEVLDWFANYLARPVRDAESLLVDEPGTFQQACFEYFYATSDEEMSFIGSPNLEENEDGDFEGTFYMPRTRYTEGMTIWGWMDAPLIGTTNLELNGLFATCNPNTGRQFEEYDEAFAQGAPYHTLLNIPSDYISEGDWVSEGTPVAALGEDGAVPEVVVTFDILVGAEEEGE